MRRTRLIVAVLGLGAVVMTAALPAEAKEAVRATLKTSLPLDAPPGARLAVAWTLSMTDEAWAARPFAADGIFVRVTSTSGVPGETVYATGKGGDYRATIVAPEGGIGDVEIGLVGWQSDAQGTRRADAIFPITNDPAPGAQRTSSQAVGDAGMQLWIPVLVGGSLALAALTLAARRRPLGRFG